MNARNKLIPNNIVIHCSTDITQGGIIRTFFNCETAYLLCSYSGSQPSSSFLVASGCDVGFFTQRSLLEILCT